MGCLYQLTFPSGKSYIGITTATFKKRMTKHISDAKHQAKTAIANAIRKYGNDFERKILVIANDWEYLCELEKRAIEAYNTFNPNGYNLTKGGDGTVGIIPTLETRKKMSEAGKGRIMPHETRLKITASNTGKVRSPEFSEKMSLLHKGKTVSQEARDKMSKAHTGKKHTKEHVAKITKANTGKKYSDEIRAKMSAAQRSRVISEDERLKKSNSRIGRYWFNNGIENVFRTICPEGFVAGMLKDKSKMEAMIKEQKLRKWFNNGEINVLSKECPDGFVAGISTSNNRNS